MRPPKHIPSEPEPNKVEPQSVKLDGFVRRLIDDGLHIESCCRLCGAVIIGSVMDGLVDKEREHVKNCPKIHATA